MLTYNDISETFAGCTRILKKIFFHGSFQRLLYNIPSHLLRRSNRCQIFVRILHVANNSMRHLIREEQFDADDTVGEVKRSREILIRWVVCIF